MYIGGWKDGNRTEGKQYMLLEDDRTHTLFHVKYDDEGEEIEMKEISKGHKIV